MNSYQISSYHEIYEDNYEAGELDRVNSYDIGPWVVKADGPLEAIAKYYNDHLHREFKPKNVMLDEDELTNTIYDSSLEDESGLKPSEYELEEWKEGRMKLYANNATIYVHELVEVDLSGFIQP